MRKDIGRREFLGKATLAALTVTAALDGGAKRGNAEAQPTANAKGSGMKMKKICVEEHWRNQEVGEIGDKWRERTKVPLSNDPKATPQVFPRIGDFEKFRLPLMDEIRYYHAGARKQLSGDSGRPGCAYCSGRSKKVQ